MGQFSKWLLHEDQKELFDRLFAIAVNVVFIALTALLLWPMGKATFALRLGKGYWIFWSVLIFTSAAVYLIQRYFRVDLYSHHNVYVISGLAVSGVLQVGWSAFLALVIRDAVAGAPLPVTIVLYGVGVISSYVASVIVGSYYTGGIYRMVNSALAILSFIVFSIWPGAGAALYGWFFGLF